MDRLKVTCERMTKQQYIGTSLPHLLSLPHTCHTFQAELDRLKVAFERMTKQHYVDTASPHLEAVQRIGQKRGDARKAFEVRLGYSWGSGVC